jgi:hypothetical protein
LAGFSKKGRDSLATYGAGAASATSARIKVDGRPEKIEKARKETEETVSFHAKYDLQQNNPRIIIVTKPPIETHRRFLHHFHRKWSPIRIIFTPRFNIPLNWAGAKAEADAKRVARTAALVNIVVCFISSRLMILDDDERGSSQASKDQGWNEGGRSFVASHHFLLRYS